MELYKWIRKYALNILFSALVVATVLTKNVYLVISLVLWVFAAFLMSYKRWKVEHEQNARSYLDFVTRVKTDYETKTKETEIPINYYKVFYKESSVPGFIPHTEHYCWLSDDELCFYPLPPTDTNVNKYCFNYCMITFPIKNIEMYVRVDLAPPKISTNGSKSDNGVTRLSVNYNEKKSVIDFSWDSYVSFFELIPEKEKGIVEEYRKHLLLEKLMRESSSK